MKKSLVVIVMMATTPAYAQEGNAAPDAGAPAVVAPAPTAINPPATPTTEPAAASTTQPAFAKEISPGLFGDWKFHPQVLLRAGYEHVQSDKRFDFIGRNNGFVLRNARAGIQGMNEDKTLSFRVTVEGASDVGRRANTPINETDVRVADAWVRYDFLPALGVQVGQYLAPFGGEDLRDISLNWFASRAVGQQGVLVGRGFEEPGLTLDRQLGIMLSPSAPIRAGAFGFNYYAMVMNGNGPNQLLDDNGKPGLLGRIEGLFDHYVAAGVAAYRNERRVGSPPNLYDEDDWGFAGDLRVQYRGLEVFGQFTRVATSFPTTGTDERVRLAYHGQIGYRIETVVPFGPAYRYAHYHPWQSADAAQNTNVQYDAFKLDYHTFGVRVWHPKWPLSGYINYTVTVEPSPRALDNNRLEIIGQFLL